MNPCFTVYSTAAPGKDVVAMNTGTTAIMNIQSFSAGGVRENI